MSFYDDFEKNKPSFADNNFFLRGMFKKVFIGIFAIGVFVFFVRLTMIGSTKSTSGHIYTITVTSYKGSQTYFGSEIIKQDDHCITFKNSWGFEETECGNYIGMTKY